MFCVYMYVLLDNHNILSVISDIRVLLCHLYVYSALHVFVQYLFFQGGKIVHLKQVPFSLSSFFRQRFLYRFIINCINSLDPERCGSNFRGLFSKLISWIDIMSTSCEIDLMSVSQDDKSTLIQVMTWSHQATSHYLNQCWPRSMLPYGITRSQWVDLNKQVHVANY